MIDVAKAEKIKRFLADRAMQEAVYEVLLDSFLIDRKGSDVHTLAAAHLSVGFLRAGWAELRKYQAQEPPKDEPKTNQGM